MVKITSQEALECLKEVMDPEIPVLSLIDLGVIVSVKIEEEVAEVKMRPTFIGCPAMDQMKLDIESRLLKEGLAEVKVLIVNQPQWTTDDISDEGREKLKSFGYAPPPKGKLIEDISIFDHIECPNCGSFNTELRSPFGPALCRSIHYCNGCLETFQQIKPLN